MGYDSQQTDEPVSPERQTNLYKPIPGDQGAHGRFDNRSKTMSLQSELNMHCGGVAAGAIVGLAVVGNS